MTTRNLLVLGLASLAVSPLFAGEIVKDDAGGYTLKEGDFTMNVDFWIQSQAMYEKTRFNFEGDFWDYLGATTTRLDSKTDFSVERARLTLSGGAYQPWLHYRLEAEYGQNGAGEHARLQDGWISMDFSEINNWKFGQFRAPFDLFQLFDEKHTSFGSLPFWTSMSGAERDLGIAWGGHLASGRFRYTLAVQNGNGPNNTANDNDGVRSTVRLEFQNQGGFDYRATALAHPDTLQWTAGLAWTSNPQGSDLVNDGSDVFCEPGAVKRCSYRTHGLSAFELFGAVRGSRWQANASYQLWSEDQARTDRSGHSASLDTDSWNVDFGLFVSDVDEIVARYGESNWKDPDFQVFDSVVLSTDLKITEWRVGYNHYFQGNHFKLQLDAGREESKFSDLLTVSPSRLAGKSGARSDTLHLLLSFYL